MQPQPGKFNFNSKQLYATYPHCGAKRQCLEYFQTVHTAYSIVVVQEDHKDGTPHLHVYVHFGKQIHKRKSDCFDFTVDGETYHGNYQKPRKLKDVLLYMTKSDKEPLQFNYNIQEKLKACIGHNKYTNKDVLETPLVTLVDEEIISIRDMPRLQAAKDFYFQEKARINLQNIGAELENTWTDPFPVDMEIKKRHYWIYSTRPNLGKTTWLKSLSLKYKTSWYSCAESFQVIYRDSQLVLLDEFAGKIPVTQLNQMCDGTYCYPTKGSRSIQLARSLVVICSNRTIIECYPKYHQFLEARFNEVCLDEYFNEGNIIGEDIKICDDMGMSQNTFNWKNLLSTKYI